MFKFFYIVLSTIFLLKLPLTANEPEPFYLTATNHPSQLQRTPPQVLTPRNSIHNIKVFGCAGEIKSISVTLNALTNVKDVSISSTDFLTQNTHLPKSIIDIRTVKWWYQDAGGASYGHEANRKRKMVLVPELLLKNDDFIRANHSGRNNWIRSTRHDGSEEYLASDSSSIGRLRPYDSKTLMPVSVKENNTKEFWINIHIPEDAEAGSYTSTLTVTYGSFHQSIDVQLTIYPFELQPSPLIYSVYWPSKLCPWQQATIDCNGQSCRSEEQYRNELANIKAHGVLYPINYRSLSYRKGLIKMLNIRNELSMPKDKFFTVSFGKGTTVPLQRVPDWIKLLDEYGYNDKYFYGIDEAKKDEFVAQISAFKKIQNLGGKTFVAFSDLKHLNESVEAVGSALNIYNLLGHTSVKTAEQIHSIGSKVFSYSNPQSAIERPAMFRLNYGFDLWSKHYDGAMMFAYEYAYGHPYDDSDNGTWKDHMFVYPTMDGVIDTISWEAVREAIYDVRYVQTLLTAIKHAANPKSENVQKAKMFLEHLDTHQDPDFLRQTIAEMVLSIN